MTNAHRIEVRTRRNNAPRDFSRRQVSTRHQRGATLLVVLVMLVVMTLFVISAVNLANLNMKAVGNMQYRKTTEALAQNGIETVLNSGTYFYTPATTVNLAAPSGFSVTVAPRICVNSDAATGYSLAQQIVPEDNTWEIQVTVADSVTGANTIMHQGTKMRMLSGNCPA